MGLKLVLMKHFLLITLFLSGIFSLTLNAQCLEITGILINACDATSDETDNEMVTFTVGSTALNVANINVTWPNIGFQGFCTSATATAGLNATITNGCGFLLEPPGGLIPAGANVILVTSTNVSTIDNTFQGLSDTLYIIYQCDGNGSAQFVNQDNTAPTTRTTYFSITGPCNQTEIVTYDGAFLNNIDGERVYFDAAGNATYDDTQGCTAPVESISDGWNFTDEICNNFGNVDLNTLLNGSTTTGGTWSGPRVIGATYNPNGYLGLDSITYSVSGTTSCSTSLDSTIVFNVIEQQTGNKTIEVCDSTLINGIWYKTDTTFTDTIFASQNYACDSLVDYTVIISPLTQDSTYIFACDSVEYNGLWIKADTIILDTVLAIGGGSVIIDTILKTGFEDSEGWTDQATGSWTQIDTYGTWSANDMYANQFNPNNGIRNIGMNDVGDWIEFPPVDYPQTLYYYDRLSGAVRNTNEYTIQYYNGTNWVTISSDICTHTNYELVIIDLSIIASLTNVSIRITRTQHDRSGYIDDIVITGSTTAAGSNCDSVIITNIDIAEPVILDTIYQCTNNPLNVGTVNDTIQYSSACDSLITSTITQLTDTSNVYLFDCTINPSLVGNDTTSILLSSLGCDSIYYITITNFIDTVTNDTTLIDCNSITYNGFTFNTDTTFIDTISSSLNCDSIYNNVNILIQPLDTTEIDTIICFGSSLILTNGQAHSTPGIYLDTLSSVTGCDSLLQYTLSVSPAPIEEFTYACTNDPLLVGRDTISITQSLLGCDSILNVTITSLVDTVNNDTILLDCSSITYNSITFNSDTMYTDTTLSALGCDSIYDNVTIIITRSDTTNIDTSICFGNSLVLSNGQIHTISGNYFDTITATSGCDSLLLYNLTVLPSPIEEYTYTCTIDPALAGNDTTSIVQSILGCDSVYLVTSTIFIDTTTIDTTIYTCDSVQYNGNIYHSDTTFSDTTMSSLLCDSIYNIVNIIITQADTFYNPTSITICSSNDSALLNDGTYVYGAGNYPITYSRVNDCDSVYITSVLTQLCNTTCTFDTLFFESFEYDTIISEIDTSTIFGNGTPNGQLTGNPIFIGLQHSGTRFAYFNFKSPAGSIFYSKQINSCPGDFRFSFWHRQYGNNLDSEITINVYDGPDNTYPLISTLDFTSGLTSYRQVISSVFTSTSNVITFEMIDNVGGPVGGNDLLFDDFLFEYCALDTIFMNQDYCALNTSFDLFDQITGVVNTNGTWTGPSALSNGYLGTFDPNINIDGDYIYNTSNSCADTTIVISTLYTQPIPETTTITDCDSLNFNSQWFYSDTIISDTIFSVNNTTCDSIYQTEILITKNDTIHNPIISICIGDNTVLPDGTVVDTSGVFITILPKTTNNCDSVIITTVQAISCNCFYDLGNDTTFCDGDSLVLDAGANGSSYLWQDNSTNQTFKVTSTGTYYCTKTTLDLNDNVVINGDFETGNTDFTSDYNYSSSASPVTCPSGNQSWGLLGCEGTYSVLTSPNLGHSNFASCGDLTTGSGNMLVVNGSNTPNTKVWCQTVNVIPNTDYLFSAWATSLENTNTLNVATLHFLIDGVQFGNNFSPSTTACNWQEFSTTWNSGSNTTIQICIESDVISGNNDYAIDDIFFTPNCVYTDTIEVTVDPIPQFDLGPDQTLCFGDSVLLDASFPNATYAWQDGSTDSTFNVTSSGSYWATTSNTTCTFSDTTQITIAPLTLADTINVEECGTSYILPGLGTSITLNGSYNDTLLSAANCDSIQPYNITFLTVDTGVIDTFICAGESFTLSDGTSVNATGIYTTNAGIAVNSCDSFVITNLTVRPIVTSTAIIIESCIDTFVIPNSGLVVSSNGIYNDTLIGNNTCDSIQPYDVTFLPNYTKTVNATICQGDSFELEGSGQFVYTTGTYNSDIIIPNDCDTTVTTNLTVENPSISVSNEATICLGDSITLTATGTSNITWNTGHTTNSITVFPTSDSTYFAQGTDAFNCLSNVDSVQINVTLPISNVSIIASSEIINTGEEVEIEVNADNVQTYSWTPNNSSNSSFIDAPIQSTLYVVEMINSPCPTILDSIFINVRQTFIAIPTGFSPNGDGFNDLFQVANYEDFEEYSMQIYNRWGELIFSATDYKAAWDGTYKGRKLEIGVYTYIIEAQHKYTNQIFNESGNITLIR